ncbi:MAG: carotenoid oxygenase family protein [Nocardioides sp.]|uniref:carotenoid oxygenase family protein n=1 Tax=Nocardioides sp. TaxID=35761 RepID=UPI003F010723
MATTEATTNQFLSGSYAPVRVEQTLTDLPVTGRIPEHLDGRYLRIGPNPIAEVDPATYHWFSGDGMVHGIRLRDGRAEWYRNRWVRGREAQRLLGETVDWPTDHGAVHLPCRVPDGFHGNWVPTA